MARTSAGSDVRTYMPDDRQDALILDFMRALEAAGGRAPDVRPALVGADGARFELPEAMFDMLRQVAEALASGMGVTVAPMNAMLTTQEAADFLGIARPTREGRFRCSSRGGTGSSGCRTWLRTSPGRGSGPGRQWTSWSVCRKGLTCTPRLTVRHRRPADLAHVTGVPRYLRAVQRDPARRPAAGS